MKLISGPEFVDLFRNFAHTARRLEVRDRYDSPSEYEPMRRFLAGEPEEAPTLEGVGAAVRAAQALMPESRYTELAELLPALLRDAEALGKEGRPLASRALHLAGTLMVSTRQFETADVALTRALDLAEDRLDEGGITMTKCWSLMRQGKLGESLDLALDTADEVEPRFSRATMAELAIWGGLLLKASAAAIRDAKPGEAEDALQLAHAAGIRMTNDVAPPSDAVRTFGPVKVTMMRTENAVIDDCPDVALRVAERVPSAYRPRSGGANRHRLDVAKAYVDLKQYDKAMALLGDVRTTVPEWLPHQQSATDIMTTVVARRRTLTPEMREMADFVGVPM